MNVKMISIEISRFLLEKEKLNFIKAMRQESLQEHKKISQMIEGKIT